MNWRRTFLKLIATLAVTSKYSYAGLLLPEINAIERKIIDTDKINIKLPKIAEKNTAILMTISTELEDIQSISILLDKPETVLMAKFNLSPQLSTFVSTRLMFTEDSNIIVLAEKSNIIYQAKAFIKIGIVGCN